MSEGPKDASYPRFTTAGRICQGCDKQWSLSHPCTYISGPQQPHATQLHHEDKEIVNSIVDFEASCNPTAYLCDSDEMEHQAIVLRNMNHLNPMQVPRVSHQNWHEHPSHMCGWDCSDSAGYPTLNTSLDQPYQSAESNPESRSDTDFWSSLTSDKSAYSTSNDNALSPATSISLQIRSENPSSRTSVNSNAASTCILPDQREISAVTEDASRLGLYPATDQFSKDQWWSQGLIADSTNEPEALYQPDIGDEYCYTDLTEMAAEPYANWQVPPNNEDAWNRDFVGLFGDMDFKISPDVALSTSYPPLPDLPPPTELDSLITQPTDECVNHMRWPEHHTINPTQQYQQAIPLLIEESDQTYMYNVPYAQYSQPSTPSALSRQSQPNVSRKVEDDFLLDCKDRKKMSYRAIKALGGFREAESTLRGRYRTLSKSKEKRLRKPEWSARDIQILKHAVAQHLRKPSCSVANYIPAIHAHNPSVHQQLFKKIPWKKIAESMALRGCYKFGNATVKKKYMEVMGIPKEEYSY